MKAKRIAKLRKRIKHFRMWETATRVGIDRSCIECNERTIHIYGLDLLDAVERYYNKRPFKRPTNKPWSTITRDYAYIAVLQYGEPIRNIKFYH